MGRGVLSERKVPPAHLLIVDDDRDGLHALSELFHLRIPSVRSQVCGSGATALEELTRIPYQVVLSDLHMPDMDGLTLLKEVKNLRPESQFMLMTGAGDLTPAMQALEHGAFDCILKPFERDELVRSARLALKAYRLRQRLQAQQDRLARLKGRRDEIDSLYVPQWLSVVERSNELIMSSWALLEAEIARLEDEAQRQLQFLTRLSQTAHDRAMSRLLAIA